MSCTCESYSSYICQQCQPEEAKPMKPNLTQLNMFSDYELNCAVAEKLGLPVRKRISKDGNSVYTDDLKGTGCFVDYCNVPNDYMPIAIEYGIDINFDSVGSNEFDTGC